MIITKKNKIRKKNRNLFLIPVFFIFMTLGSCNVEPSNEKKALYTLSPEEKNLIQEGDIILRHGYGMVSNIISKTLKEEYSLSHCAIVVKDSLDNYKVVHSVSQSISDYDGVQIQDFNLFINDSKPNSVIIVRYKALEEDHKAMVREKTMKFLNQQIPFDHKFDISDTTEFFCTELIWRVFLDLFNDDILDSENYKGSLSAFKFAFFLDPRRFEIIINHHHR